jgi:hypothetical protein
MIHSLEQYILFSFVRTNAWREFFSSLKAAIVESLEKHLQ